MNNNETPQTQNHGNVTVEKFIVGRFSEIQPQSGFDISNTNFYVGEPEPKYKNGNKNDVYPTMYGSRSRAKKFDTYPAASDLIKTLEPGMYCIEKIFIVKPAS